MSIKSSASAEPVLDFENALARLGGDRELFADLAGYVIEDTPPLFQAIQSALVANDATTMRMKSHAIKGLIAGCGGIRASLIAQSLEDAGNSGDLGQSSTLVSSLGQELDELTKALAAYLR